MFHFKLTFLLVAHNQKLNNEETPKLILTVVPTCLYDFLLPSRNTIEIFPYQLSSIPF